MSYDVGEATEILEKELCIDGKPRQTRTPAFEEVLERVGNDLSTSTLAITHAMGTV